jgi:hypothetical protein
MNILLSIVVATLILLIGMIFVDKKGCVAMLALLGGVVAFLVLSVMINLNMMLLRTWLDYSGPVIAMGVVVIIALGIGTSIDSRNSLKAPITASVLFVVVVIIFGIGDVAANPRESICQEDQTNRLVGTLNINLQDVPFRLDNVNPNQSIVTDEDMAMFAASNVVGQYATYARLGSSQHLEVNGLPRIVIDLRPRSYTAFNDPGQLHGQIPGFYMVDPTTANGSATFVSAPMTLVPGLEASRSILPLTIENDLERRVFNEILLPNGWQALGLTQLELNDQMQPRYTALLIKPMVGTTGYLADAFLVVDPTVAGQQSGSWYQVYDITHPDVPYGQPIVYDVSAVPAWVNNIFPREYFTWWIEQWGKYEFHTLCQWNGGTAFQYMIDRSEDRLLANGHRIYQYSMTSMNPDSAMTMMLYADPRTGAINGYRTEGEYALPNLASVENTFRVITERLYTGGYIPTETELTQWAGYDVFTVVLKTVTATSNDIDEHSFARYGVVLANADATRNQANYIVASSPEEAYQLFLQSLAGQDSLGADRGATTDLITIEGEVIAVGVPYVDGTTTRISFMIRTDDGLVYRFVTIADEESTMLAVGHRVAVEAIEVQTVEFNPVAQLFNLTLDALSQ